MSIVRKIIDEAVDDAIRDANRVVRKQRSRSLNCDAERTLRLMIANAFLRGLDVGVLSPNAAQAIVRSITGEMGSDTEESSMLTQLHTWEAWLELDQLFDGKPAHFGAERSPN